MVTEVGVGARGFRGGSELFGQVVEAGIDDTGPRARDGEKERARAECLGCGVRKSASGLSTVRKVGLSSGPALSASRARARGEAGKRAARVGFGCWAELR